MDKLEEDIRAVFRRVSLNTRQLGFADLEEIEKGVLALLSNKVVVDKQRLEELMKEFPTAFHTDRQAKKKFQEFFDLTEKAPKKG